MGIPGRKTGRRRISGGLPDPGIREELGIEIEICNIYKVIYYKYPQITVLLLVYSCRYKSGTPRPLDCKDFRWVNVSDLDLYEFAPADEELIQELKKAGQK